MWKKTDDNQEIEQDEPQIPQKASSPQPAPGASRPGAPRRSDGNGVASIGPTILIKGEISGDEKLLVQGSIEGSVNIKGNEFVIGSQARIKANVSAQSILVEGEILGDMRATELITLKSNAHVQGSVTAPRIVVEDGCKFKGKIDMESDTGSGNSSSAAGMSSASAGAAKTSTSTSAGASASTAPAGANSGSAERDGNTGRS